MTRIDYVIAIVGAFACGEQVEQENTGAKGWFFEHDAANKCIWVHTDHGSPEFSGDAEDLVSGRSSEAELTPSALAVPQSTLDEEKMNVLPSFTNFKGLLVGTLDFDGDERPLYVIDNEITIRQFELAEDWVQNDPEGGDEFWPLHKTAYFMDQPNQPTFELYLPCEFDYDGVSAYYPGIGRKGQAGHKGSFGFCRWSRTAKRWEYIEGCFKVAGVGVVKDAMIGGGNRGVVTLWWKKLDEAPPAVVIEGSGEEVVALNWYYERLRQGTKVALAFDRQENVWYIIDCENPVMVEGTFDPPPTPPVGPAFVAEVGKLIFDDVDPGPDAGAVYFVLTNPGGDLSQVQVNVNVSGKSATFDPNGKTSMTFLNGLLTATVP